DGHVRLRASEMQPRRRRHIWYDRVYAGALNLFCGRTGVNKSTLQVDIAARYTRGDPMPNAAHEDGAPRNPPQGNVVWLSGEDDPRSVLLPRLVLAAAETERVLIRDVEDMSLPNDWPALLDDLDEVNAGMLVLDPLNAFCNIYNPVSVQKVLK